MESDHTEEASVQRQFRHLIEFAQSALTAENRAEFAERAVLEIASMMRSRAVLLYLLGAESGVPRLFRYGLENEDDRHLMEMCGRGLEVLDRGGAPAIDATSRGGISLSFLPLEVSHARVGLLGVEISTTAWPDWTNKLIALVEAAIGRYDQQSKTEKRLAQLNAYLTVSSMLGQSIGVQDQLEAALYCCMDAVSAEAGSVLLLDDEKKSFVFYQVEGPKKPILKSATFPADTGLAGAILRSGQSELIDDVTKDPRFYRAVDAESGFETKNMIAIPLTADGEAIGVLE